MSLEAEIRAYRRKRPKNEDGHFWAIAFGVAFALVGAIFMHQKIHAMKQEAHREQQLIEERRQEEEIAAIRAAQARQRALPAITTESGRVYYAPETPAPPQRQKSNIERYDEALAWMESSRRTQRQIDGSGRYRIDGSHNVVGAKSPGNVHLCKQLQRERDDIHARMRQGYDNLQGERYRRQLDRNFRNWCDYDCGSC